MAAMLGELVRFPPASNLKAGCIQLKQLKSFHIIQILSDQDIQCNIIKKTKKTRNIHILIYNQWLLGILSQNLTDYLIIKIIAGLIFYWLTE